MTASPHVRLNLKDLLPGDVESLRQAMRHMEEDGSFDNLAKSVIGQSASDLVDQSICHSVIHSLPHSDHSVSLQSSQPSSKFCSVIGNDRITDGGFALLLLQPRIKAQRNLEPAVLEWDD